MFVAKMARPPEEHMLSHIIELLAEFIRCLTLGWTLLAQSSLTPMPVQLPFSA